MKKLICFLLAFTMTGITFVSAEDYPVNIPKLTGAMPTGGFMKPEGHGIEITDSSRIELFSQEPEKSLEEYLFEETMKHTEEIDVSMYNLTIDEFNNAFESAVFSNGYMPVTTIYEYYPNKGIVSSVFPTYIFSTAEEAKAAYENLVGCVNTIYDYACTGKTDLEKVLFTYEKIVLDFNYDPDKKEDGTFKTISYTPYGFTENGYAVCQGYSLLFGIILDKFGIENGFCSSDEVNHIWNYIKVDGNWYHCDSTWGELKNNDGTPAEGYVSYDHFMRSDGIEEHGDKSKWEVYGISSKPDCSSTEYESGYMFNGNQYPIYRQGNKFCFNYIEYNLNFVSSTLKNKGPFFSDPVIDTNNNTYSIALLSYYNLGEFNKIDGFYENKTKLTDVKKSSYNPSGPFIYNYNHSLPNKKGIIIKHILTGSDMITPLAECAVIEGSDYN